MSYFETDVFVSVFVYACAIYVLSLSGMAERNAWSRTRFAIL